MSESQLQRPKPQTRFTKTSKWLSRIAGALLLTIVAFVYVSSLLRARVPPGHPWSGLCLGSFGTAQIFDTQAHSWTRIAIYGAALAVALPWLLSSLGL